MSNDFEGIIDSATLVGEKTASLTEASDEVAKGIEHVNVAVTQIDSVTQRTAASAEESASASEQMNAQAEKMKGTVRSLTGLVSGTQEIQARTT